MKPSNRWAILVLVAIVIGISLLLWNQRGEQQAPDEGKVAKQSAEPAPAAAKPEAAAEKRPEVAAVPIAPKASEAPLTAAVLFEFDRSALRPGEAAKLDALADRLKGKSFDRLEAVGHADRIGTDTYNLRLSERRAEAARAYLIGKDVVDAGRVRVEAKGEREPATGEACKGIGAEQRENRKLVDCLQPDRRAEIAVVGLR